MTRWVEVGDGVLVRRYTELDLSVGLVVGGHSCLVVDTRGNPAQGAELHSAVREVTRRPCVVVLTHAHFDHCLGTAAFLPTTVWAHPRCRDDLARGGVAQHAEALAWAHALELPGAVELVPPVVPDRVVTGPTELDLGDRRVLLMHPGRGHTDHDVVAFSPDTGVLFAGDLVEQGADPDFTDAYPLDWPSAVTTLLRFGPQTVVPGHGDPVDTAFTRTQRDQLAAVAGLCQTVLTDDLAPEELVAASPFGRVATLAALARSRLGRPETRP